MRASGERGPPTSSRGAFAAACAALLVLASCERGSSGRVQGYIEGEFVYVSAPRAGSLTSLEIAKGDQVEAGRRLFALDEMPERAARDQAQRDVERAEAAWADAKKGQRPSELAAAEAELGRARAALDLSEKELARQDAMLATAGATTEHEVDRARAARDQDRQRVAELAADLETARLGARADQVAAAEADVRAARAALERAEWDLAEKRQASPAAGLVFDTLYREGEWVEAGLPVVMLLPPEGVKLRTFVSEERVGSLRIGDGVLVHVDGVAGTSAGTISYVAPRAEYTPPVVYSRENRRKFVFLVEAVFAPDVARGLHPGQPVDVELAPLAP